MIVLDAKQVFQNIRIGSPRAFRFKKKQQQITGSTALAPIFVFPFLDIRKRDALPEKIRRMFI